MIKIEFTQEEIKQLHYERFHHPHPRVQQRIETVYLKALGYSHQEIGRVMCISQNSTVTNQWYAAWRVKQGRKASRMRLI
jgi:hypothetical protein